MGTPRLPGDLPSWRGAAVVAEPRRCMSEQCIPPQEGKGCASPDSGTGQDSRLHTHTINCCQDSRLQTQSTTARISGMEGGRDGREIEREGRGQDVSGCMRAWMNSGGCGCILAHQVSAPSAHHHPMHARGHTFCCASSHSWLHAQEPLLQRIELLRVRPRPLAQPGQRRGAERG